MLRIILITASLFVIITSEKTSYELLVQLVNRYEYAMNPEQPEDESIITSLPKLYSDALKIFAEKQGDAITSELICVLLIGIFKNYANIIKDNLASSKSPYVSKKFVASTANWSTWLLEVTLGSGLYNYTTQQQCDDNTKTPLELACSLMLHKPMVMLTSQELYDAEQLYNCLLLCTVNSDIEGFNIILSRLNGNDSCEVIKNNCSGTVLSRALKNVNLSTSFDVAHFHCKTSNNCIMYEHVCGTLHCHELCQHQITDVLSTHYTELSDTRHEQQLLCPYGYVYVVSGYHGWRTGFTMETDKCEIPSVDIRQLSEEMLELFSGIKQPLVIKGVGSDWNLSIKWIRNYLQKHFGSMEVLGGSIPYGEIFGETFGYVTIEEYLMYMDRHRDELPPNYYSRPIVDQSKAILPLYVFDIEVLRKYFGTDYAIPAVFKVWNATEHHQFILGPPGSGAPFHFHCHAINFLTYGRKKWLLTPPGTSVYSKLHPLMLYSSRHIDMLSHLKPLECMQNAGDMLYIPSGWGHATINIDESIGFAVEFELPNC